MNRGNKKEKGTNQYENSSDRISPCTEWPYHLWFADSQDDDRDVIDTVHRHNQDCRDCDDVFELAAGDK